MHQHAVLAACALVATLGCARADSLTYSNDRFGTRITFPAEMFETRMEPPENGDGMGFTSADGATLTVYGSFNALEYSPEELLQDTIERRQTDGKVTYSQTRNNWVVVSGIEGNDIYYERHVIGAQDVIHSVIIVYPKELAGKYNPVVGPIANSLGGP